MQEIIVILVRGLMTLIQPPVPPDLRPWSERKYVHVYLKYQQNIEGNFENCGVVQEIITIFAQSSL